MNELIIFNNEEFGEIRVIEIDNEPWFVGNDVANVLGYSNPRKAVSDHVDDEDKGVTKCYTLGGKQNVTIINESGLYSLILSSKMPNAKKFKHWVTSEVIPSIRKHGAYMTEKTLEQALLNPDYLVQLALKLKEETDKRKQLEIDKQQLESEVAYKEDVIVGLVEDIDLATKRQRINQIVRHGVSDSSTISSRWKLLYGEFEKKYHLNLSVRLERNKNDFKPKLKNNLDLVDRQMHMIPQLYEICCKLFENDVAALMAEWECMVTQQYRIMEEKYV